jgi:hypothetical protein
MNTNVNFSITSLAIAILTLSSPALADPTAAWVTSLTATAVQDADYEGEVVEITVAGGTVTGCSLADFYVIRDTAIIHGSLSLAMAALIADRQLDLFVTGACDPTGRPLVGAVNMH